MIRLYKSSFALLTSFVLFLPTMGIAQQQDESDAPKPATLKIDPIVLRLEVGESANLSAIVLDKDGARLDTPVLFFSRARQALEVSRDGQVTARLPGEYSVLAMTQGGNRDERIRGVVPVKVAYPPIAQIQFATQQNTFYAGTIVPLKVHALDAKLLVREDANIALSSSDEKIATVDDHGHLVAHAEGKFTLTAAADDATAQFDGEVVALPVSSLSLDVSESEARTGDVIGLEAIAKNANGDPISDAPIIFSYTQQRTGESLSTGGSGQLDQAGRFVAEAPGLYWLVASCGPHSVRKAVQIEPRNVARKVEVVGRGRVTDTHTSDLWVWEAANGRDYAVTGTWGADGEAHFWEVTDPENIKKVSSVKVDARTVNDVKISESGRICVISREGASNRRNGIVIYDVSDPEKPELLSSFDDGLTGGVHNIFIYEDHVYAINNGRRYDIINIEDPRNPKRVGRFELSEPGHAVHDVWVTDGLAYSSNWGHGLYVVDVGNGIKGGSPANPQVVLNYVPPNVSHHAAFPYNSSETGKKYVICGDERFPYGLSTENKPTIAGGYLHFVDITDPENPLEVARYELPEAGSHNFWVQGDVLFTAMYNKGFRAVDISGDLMGDLSKQGREIAWHLPFDHEGFIPNAAMVWGPQPHKGIVYFSDWNSGLWAVRLVNE